MFKNVLNVSKIVQGSKNVHRTKECLHSLKQCSLYFQKMFNLCLENGHRVSKKCVMCT